MVLASLNNHGIEHLKLTSRLMLVIIEALALQPTGCRFTSIPLIMFLAVRTETAACSSAESVLDLYKRWKGKRDTSTGNEVTRLLSITIAEKQCKIQSSDL